MEMNRLGRTGIEVTRLGFGGGPFGGLFTALDDETAAKAMEAAWDNGIRYFDTSPHYGIGHSERRMGEFLRHRPRDEYILSTKVGRLLVPQDAAGRMDPVRSVGSRCWPRRSSTPAAMPTRYRATSIPSRPTSPSNYGRTCAPKA